MAIIEELGLEVKVKVNDSTAAEYPDEEPDAEDNAYGQAIRSCYHYVESVDNAAFYVQAGVFPGPKGPKTSQEWFSRSRNHALSFTVAIDGGHAVEAVLVDQHSGPRRLEGIRNTADKTMRKFCFAPVSTGRF